MFVLQRFEDMSGDSAGTWNFELRIFLTKLFKKSVINTKAKHSFPQGNCVSHMLALSLGKKRILSKAERSGLSLQRAVGAASALAQGHRQAGADSGPSEKPPS